MLPWSAVRLMPRPVRVVPLYPDLVPLPVPSAEEKAAHPPDVLTDPTGGNALIPGCLKDRAQVRACRNLPRLQRLTVLVPEHEPGRPRNRLEGIGTGSACHARRLPAGRGRSARRGAWNWMASSATGRGPLYGTGTPGTLPPIVERGTILAGAPAPLPFTPSEPQ